MLTKSYTISSELYTEEHHRLILSCLFNNTSGIGLTKFNTRVRISYSLLLRTTDGKYVLGYRKTSFAYESLCKDSFEITSMESLFRRVANMYRSFSESERYKFRQDLYGPITIPTNSYISIIDLLKLLRFRPPRPSLFDEAHTNEFILPGGQMNKRDKNILDTSIRETREELSISENVNIIIHDDKCMYLNIFDCLISKFFHNIVFYADIELSSVELKKTFKPNHEINSIMFVNELPLYLRPLIK